jgi:hypothetical protein
MEIKFKEKTRMESGFNSSLKPLDLFDFSLEYKNYVSCMKENFEQNEGKSMKIILCRLDGEGNVKKKMINGIMGKSHKTFFTFFSNEDFHNCYDYEKELTVHFDNIIGDVPLTCSGKDINPFRINRHNFSLYFNRLSEMRELLKNNIGKKCTSYLDFKHQDRTVRIESKILEVNRSNIKILHIKTKSGKMIDLIPRIEFIKLVTPIYYLSHVFISDSELGATNSFDDYDYY